MDDFDTPIAELGAATNIIDIGCNAQFFNTSSVSCKNYDVAPEEPLPDDLFTELAALTSGGASKSLERSKWPEQDWFAVP